MKNFFILPPLSPAEDVINRKLFKKKYNNRRRGFPADQNIFSTEAVIIPQTFADEKIFNSPL